MIRLGARTGGGRARSAPTLGVLSSKRRGRRGGESQRLSALRKSEVNRYPVERESIADVGSSRKVIADVGKVGVDYLERLCETEELKKQLRKSSGKLRELAAKLARNG